MVKGSHIIRGWAKSLGVLQVSDEERKLSEERLKICEKCPFAKSSKVLKLMHGNEHHLDDMYCEKCGCPVIQKSLVKEENCPLNKWSMKYEIYKKDCPVLVLVSISDSGYTVSANTEQAMLFDAERDAEDAIAQIPNSTSSLWGTRPHRPK